MQLSDVRFLFGYDRWATTRILDAAAGIDETTWSAANAIGDRGLGGILVHALGAHQRWRHGLSSRGEDEGPRPERGPLPTVAELRAAWETEWPAMSDWLDAFDDGDLDILVEAVPIWQMLVHVVNHGTQHRAEAAALLTAAGHSPGELDMIDYSESIKETGG